MSATVTRVEIVQARLEELLRTASVATSRLEPTDRLSDVSSLTVERAIETFEDQVTSRWLDIAARELKKRNLGYYTISSAGHEQNAIVGALLRLNDPCFLHYRSGGLMMARARRLEGSTPILDTMLSYVASSEDPSSGGRHKVWGSRALWVPPQTSTIASHLPKASGLAFALRHARRVGLSPELSDDSIVCCSFGDASANHATALSGINAARYAVRRGGSAPILFLCEDNGIGISVETPRDWIRDTFSNQTHLDYLEARGEIDEIWDVVDRAIDTCRRKRSPVFLHLRCTRLWGHAGTDVETTYRRIEEIEAAEAADPLLINARRLIETGAASPDELRQVISKVEAQIAEATEEALRRPKLRSAEEVVKPLAPYDDEECRSLAKELVPVTTRNEFFGANLPEQATAPTKRTMAAHINSTLADEMLRFPEITVFGEDVAKKGGVYYVTAGLQRRFGIQRVFDTLLDETTILGVAQGSAMLGLLPVPEIQYLAYLHNALDQIRGEACSLSFFSNNQFTNPMVVRIAGLAYQKGFGGHFHNDNSIGALRDIPGLMLAVPSRGDDAAKLFRGCIAAAKKSGRVVCFLEPIALYHEKDLYEDGDSRWLSDYPPPGEMLLPGEPGVHEAQAKDVLIVSYANGLRLSLRAARVLRERHGIAARVLDLRWLNPLPSEAVREHAAECGRVLVADECRATGGGVADAIVSALAEDGFRGHVASVRAVDSYVPLAAAANLVLISEDQIVTAARKLMERPI